MKCSVCATFAAAVLARRFSLRIPVCYGCVVEPADSFTLFPARPAALAPFAAPWHAMMRERGGRAGRRARIKAAAERMLRRG